MEISGSDEDLFVSDDELSIDDEVRLRPSLLSSTVNTFARQFVNTSGQLRNDTAGCVIIEDSAEISEIQTNNTTMPKVSKDLKQEDSDEEIIQVRKKGNKHKITSDSEESNAGEITLNSDEAELMDEQTENEDEESEAEESEAENDISEFQIMPVRKKHNQITDVESDAEVGGPETGDEGSEVEDEESDAEDEESEAEDEESEAEDEESEAEDEESEAENERSKVEKMRRHKLQKKNEIRPKQSIEMSQDSNEEEHKYYPDDSEEFEKIEEDKQKHIESEEIETSNHNTNGQVNESLDETVFTDNIGVIESNLSMEKLESEEMETANPNANGPVNESLDETVFTDNIGVIESNLKMEKLDDSSLLIKSVASTSKKSATHLINESYRNPRKAASDSEDSVNEIFKENSAVVISSEDESFLYEKPLQNVPRTPKVLKQQNIKEMIARHTPVKQEQPSQAIKHCTKKEYGVQQQKVENIKKKIFETEKALKLYQLDSLPDGGRLLKKRSTDLAIELQREEEILKQLARPGNKTPKNVGGAVSWQELQKLSNQVQPGGFGGKQAMETYNAQKAQIMSRLKSFHGSLKSRPDKDVMIEDPQGLKIELMPHQKHALAFLLWRETQSPPGGILADDMGLGKTLTMISLILKSKEKVFDGGKDTKKKVEIEDSDEENDPEVTGYHSSRKSALLSGGTLIVCPASLVNQWAAEIQRRCSRNILTVGLYHGSNRMQKASQLANFDVVITTYNLVGRERDMTTRLNGVKWNRIILDEAHVVRNYKSQSSLGVCNLRAKHRWCLTGTPIQNKEIDVFALLKFLRCRPLDEISIWRSWIDNKSAGGQDRLNVIIQSIMLRRTKEELQNDNGIFKLPEKQIKCIDVALTKEETTVYQKILFLSQNLFAQFLHQRAEKNAAYSAESNGRFLPVQKNEEYLKIHRKLSKLNGSEPIQAAEILVLLLRLRQICCHPGLIKTMLDAVAKAEEGMEDEQGNDIDLLEQIEKLNIEEDLNESIREENPEQLPMSLGIAATKVLNADNPIFNFKFRSSKIALIIATLKQNVIPQGEKAVIVSQWTSMLEVIEAHLLREGIESEMLSGKVPVPKRMMMVDAFNSPTNKLQVLLLSLTAGGVGLNLVGANHLLLVDLHWNPQLEAQAMDRIYRMGQKKPVTIYKLMTLDSIEERIKSLQEMKLAMAESLLTGSTQVTGSKLTIEDMKMLFNMA